MDFSDNLELPYIMPSQAQKHVTHNEAIGMLDALVQLAVVTRQLAAPPSSPGNGECYIVAAGASGAWSGHDNAIAHRLDGAWSFYPPRAGFLCHVADEVRFVFWTDPAGRILVRSRNCKTSLCSGSERKRMPQTRSRQS